MGAAPVTPMVIGAICSTVHRIGCSDYCWPGPVGGGDGSVGALNTTHPFNGCAAAGT